MGESSSQSAIQLTELFREPEPRHYRNEKERLTVQRRARKLLDSLKREGSAIQSFELSSADEAAVKELSPEPKVVKESTAECDQAHVDSIEEDRAGGGSSHMEEQPLAVHEEVDLQLCRDPSLSYESEHTGELHRVGDTPPISEVPSDSALVGVARSLGPIEPGKRSPKSTKRRTQLREILLDCEDE
jgi:hypothetical protein